MALRQKPRASILVSTGMVKQGQAHASVTMGSTGAAMAAAAVVLGLSEGVDRPALGGPVVGVSPNTFIIDLGTNVDCRPSQMLSFAVIGDVFARQFWGVEQPRVALLSVGEEAGKGNRQVRETTALLEKSGLNFIGNVEGDDLATGRAEVVVCDGFVGNIVMKLTEGLGEALSSHIGKSLKGKLGDADLDAAVRDLHTLNNIVQTHGGRPHIWSQRDKRGRARVGRCHGSQTRHRHGNACPPCRFHTQAQRGNGAGVRKGSGCVTPLRGRLEPMPHRTDDASTLD